MKLLQRAGPTARRINRFLAVEAAQVEVAHAAPRLLRRFRKRTHASRMVVERSISVSGMSAAPDEVLKEAVAGHTLLKPASFSHASEMSNSCGRCGIKKRLGILS